MLAGVAYDANVNTAADDAISYLQLAYTDEAIALEEIRQPLLRAAIAEPPLGMTRHVLYASGLEQAELLQYMNRPMEAQASVAALTAAMVATGLDERTLPADERVPIEAARKQYRLLGQPLPELTLSMSLANPTEVARLDPQFGAGTALLLFPDWCAQCVRLAGGIGPALQHFGMEGVHVYAVMAGQVPERTVLFPPKPKAAVKPVAGAAPAEPQRDLPLTPAQILLHTPTLIVPPETMGLFSATDFPLVVVTDHAGVVRFLGVAPETALQPNNYLDQIAEHITKQWPAAKQAAQE